MDKGSEFYKQSGVASSIFHIIGQILLILLVVFHVIIPCPKDNRSYSPVLHCFQLQNDNKNFEMLRCPLLDSEMNSTQQCDIIYDKLKCKNYIFPITWSIDGNYVTVCEGIQWWLPLLIITCLLIFFHLIGCKIIIKYLNKILDPIYMLKKSKSEFCSLANCFQPAWSGSEGDILEIIEDFLSSPSKNSLKRANVKLQQIFKSQLIDLSIDHGYIEIVQIIVDELNIPVTFKMLQRSFQNGNAKISKILLKKLKPGSYECEFRYKTIQLNIPDIAHFKFLAKYLDWNPIY